MNDRSAPSPSSDDLADRFVASFRLAARQAGALAMRLQGEVVAGTKPGQETAESAALTVADLAAQDVVLLALHEALPGIAIDAEEETDSVELFAPAAAGRPIVVVDPIDGTLNYSRGSPDFAVMAALVVDDRYEASVVHFPRRQVTFWARRGGGSWRAGPGGAAEPVSVRPAARLLVSPDVGERVRAGLAGGEQSVELSRCSAVDACAPVLAPPAAALSAGGPDRRRAVGFLVTLEAGGVVLLADGSGWDRRDPRGLPPEACGCHAVAADAAAARRLLAAAGA
jgi:fructose-1,6-bisphosphatase/inositol monophosphatase family enzyme